MKIKWSAVKFPFGGFDVRVCVTEEGKPQRFAAFTVHSFEEELLKRPDTVKFMKQLLIEKALRVGEGVNHVDKRYTEIPLYVGEDTWRHKRH